MQPHETPANAAPELLTVREAACILRQRTETVHAKIRSGRLRAFRLGETGPFRIERCALSEHLRERVPSPGRADPPGGVDAPPGPPAGRAAARHTNERSPHDA